MLYLGELDKERGWVKQLHLGAMRNNNAYALKHLGPDTGYDSIGDFPQGAGLSNYLASGISSAVAPWAQDEADVSES